MTRKVPTAGYHMQVYCYCFTHFESNIHLIENWLLFAFACNLER